jgi:hypothetical protein
MTELIRIKTSCGNVSLPKNMIIKQECTITKKEKLYTLYLSTGSKVDIIEPIDGYEPVIVDRTVSSFVPPKQCSVEYHERKLPSADSSEIVVQSLFNVEVKRDDFADEKVKGETFYTHKTAPGLVIKTPEGKIKYETKMSDMYKRRD